MSTDWLGIGDHPLQVGEEAADAIKELFGRIAQASSGRLDSIQVLLEELLEDGALSPVAQSLGEKLLNNKQLHTLHRYLQPLESVEQQSDEKRVFGWPEKAWTREEGFEPGEFAITLAASGSIAGGAYFSVSNDPDPFDDQLAEASLDLFGQLEADFGMRGSVNRVGFGAGLDALLRRSLTYDMQFARGLPTYEALAFALRLLGYRLNELSEVLSAFEPTARGRLQGLRYTGRQTLGLKANGTVAIPLQGAGAVSLGFSAGFDTGSNFSLQAEPGPTQGTLLVRSEIGNSRKRQAELNVGYSLGIGDLSTELVRDIAGRLSDADKLLEALHDDLTDAQTWLKPGTVLQGKLTDLLKESFGGEGDLETALRQALGRQLGLGAQADAGNIADFFSQELASQLDNRLDLFGDDESAEVITKLRHKLIIELPAEGADRLDDALAKSGEWLDSKIRKQAESLDQTAVKQLGKVLGREPEQVFQDLQAYLKQMREKIAEIAAGIEEGNLELLAAQVAWSRAYHRERSVLLEARVDEDGADFFRQLIHQPARATARALNQPLPGVELRGSGTDIAATSLTTGKWNVAILDLPFSGSSETLSKVRVVRTQSGVTVGSESRIRKVAAIASDSREATFADAMSIATMSDGDNSTEVARISMDLTHVDGRSFGGWSSREIKRFIDGFREAGMLDVNVRSAVMDRFEEIREQTGRRTVAGRLSAVLVLPPEMASLMLQRAADPKARSLVAEAVAGALFADDTSRRRFRKAIADALVSIRRSRREQFLDDGGAKQRDDNSFAVDVKRALMALDADFVSAVPEPAKSPIEAAFKALESLQQYVTFLAEVREAGLTAQRGEVDANDLENLRDRLLDRNRAVARSMKKHWVKSGGLPIFASPPSRTVAMFRVLRFVSQRALNLPAQPPVIIRFEPEGMNPSFYSVAVDDSDDA